MLAALYLVVSSLAGFAVATRLTPKAPVIVRVPAGFLIGVVFTSWTAYAVAYVLSSHTNSALTVGVVVSTLLSAGVLAWQGRSLRLRDLRLPPLDAVLALASLVFSYWLMHAHLRNKAGELVVSSNTWGDMGLHIALSRSFSVGDNYPTQYPFFAGEPIRYHFGFDFFAGMLQRGGFSVLWSFNLPGILGFSGGLLILFATARMLFGPTGSVRWWRDRGVWAGLIAMAVLATNQSLGWLRFVDRDAHGSMWDALRPSLWWHHEGYLTQGPYTDDRIAMFNTLNVYLTQIHLVVAMAVVLFLNYLLLEQLRSGDRLDRRVLFAVGLTFGLAFWLNGVVWLAAAVYFGMLLVIWCGCACWRRAQQASSGLRWSAVRAQGSTWVKLGALFVVPALALGVPQAVLLNGGSTSGGLRVHVGYLVCASTRSGCHGREMSLLSLSDWWDFVQYWWLNEGLFIPLLVLAFVLGSRRDKKIIAAATAIFIWGSLFQVGLDDGGQNHKVFNLWENVNGIFVGFAIVELWCVGGRWLRRGYPELTFLGLLTRAATVIAVFFLVVSGLIDFMTIKNDYVVSVFGDETQKETIAWIVADTPPRASFLTDYDQLYTAPTMAGRRIALGYSSWASSAGYDIAPRIAEIVAIYSAPTKDAACSLLRASGLDYVVVGPQERSSTRFQLNTATFAAMKPTKTIGSGANQYDIYGVVDNCR